MSPPKSEAPSAATLEASENIGEKSNANDLDHGSLSEKRKKNFGSIALGEPPEAENGLWRYPEGVPQPIAAGRPSQREQQYLEMCRTESGEIIDLEYFCRRKEERAKLLQQSEWIADRLEEEGVEARGEANLSMVGLCSGAVVELPDFRNIVFIPFIAARKRAPMLRHLEYFMSRHRYCRMWVFTSGIRTPLGQIRNNLRQMHRRLSKLNAEPFMKENGVQIVFRSSELGSVKRNEAGEPTFHVHAHTIVRLSEKLSSGTWSNLLQSLHAWWKAHVSDARRIHQAREACKYLVKPQDLLDLSGSELKVLYEQTFRMHLVQPLGLLKEQVREMVDASERLVRKQTSDGPQWHRVKDWNGGKRGEKKKTIKDHDQPLSNWVTATIQPAPILSPVSEPIAIVMNHDSRTLNKKERVRRAREAAMQAFTEATFHRKAYEPKKTKKKPFRSSGPESG